ncbi:hypothetical protein [Mycolicibacterium sp. XJ1904]
MNPEFDDYTIRLREVLERLSEVYPRRLETILLEIELPGSDELTNRKDSPSIAGSIGWRAGEHQIVGFRKTLTASAKAAEERQRQFGKSHRKVAQDFMAQLRMGQTRPGSFIITALSPVGPLPTANKGGVYDHQFVGVTGREVIETLESSLKTLRSASDEYLQRDNDEVFDETISSGVSVDLLKGLRENLGTAEATEMTIEWNPRVPRTTESPRSEIVFEARHRLALRSAQSRLQHVEAASTVNLLGTVVSLDRETPGEPGVITVRILEGADADVVLLSLGNEYNEAVESHKKGDLVRVRGVLARDGRKYWMRGLDEFSLIDSRGYEQRLIGSPVSERQEITAGESSSAETPESEAETEVEDYDDESES